MKLRDKLQEQARRLWKEYWEYKEEDVFKIIDLAIQEAKKEVFDDIWKWLPREIGSKKLDELLKLKKRHLSTFANEQKQHNSDFIQDDEDILENYKGDYFKVNIK